VNENEVEYTWECSAGEFKEKHKQTTIWTAPDMTGEFIIRLKAKFMGNTEEGEKTIKVVRSPASGWGSITGYILDEDQNRLKDIIITTITGESDTTDHEGFFYIPDIPQGSNRLDFSNIGYPWVGDIPGSISILSGSNNHIGEIYIYYNHPPEILSYEKLPEHQSIILIDPVYPSLYQYYELYSDNDADGLGTISVQKIQPTETEIIIMNEEDFDFYAFRAVPVNGETSTYSTWTQVSFVDAIDPDASLSYFTYNNFFSATLFWRLTGYEEYYKGFRIAQVVGDTLYFVSNMLAPTIARYDLLTSPGMTDDYYVVAITKSGKYVDPQPETQKILLDVPEMLYPDAFRGKYQPDTLILLSWIPVAYNNSWYSGYIIEKTTKAIPQESDWELLERLYSSNTGAFIDDSVSYGNSYNYRIKTVAYPSGLGEPAYSLPYSIIVQAQ